MSVPFSDEFVDNLLANVYRLWLTPEVRRRMSAGTLSGDTVVWAIQVILEVGAPPDVRINEEVEGVFGVHPDAPLPEGSTVTAENLHTVLANVHGFERIAEDRPNAGHITVLFHAHGYYLDFDLRYNASFVADHIRAATEFVETARHAHDQDRMRVVVANLHIAVELLAKAHLLLHPDADVMAAKSHGFLRGRYNRYSHHGGTEPRFAGLLNRLDELRNPARYAPGSFAITAEESRTLLADVDAMLDFVLAAAPRRTHNLVSRIDGRGGATSE